ncbi:MAG: hypothetical protein ACLT8H_09985 [Streptococcus parasanguinis]
MSLHTYDPDYIYFADPYEVTFKTDSISATIPIVEDSRSSCSVINQVKKIQSMRHWQIGSCQLQPFNQK